MPIWGPAGASLPVVAYYSQTQLLFVHHWNTQNITLNHVSHIPNTLHHPPPPQTKIFFPFIPLLNHYFFPYEKSLESTQPIHSHPPISRSRNPQLLLRELTHPAIHCSSFEIGGFFFGFSRFSYLILEFFMPYHI